ncbi:hypothetical protein ND812_13140 [Leptospira sp. 3 VSF25]|uniref:Alginate export domain-containing protein n=2 Tax=Leptospira limi TaxID=2950023 RepID=A0ABT3M0B6_9LEPT|nr:hypothetical protein [Leptospira limi]MCW7463038.1 hypothetical protein [Leptospira limi]
MKPFPCLMRVILYFLVLTSIPLTRVYGVGLEFGIYGFELFLKEKQNTKPLEVPNWDFHNQRWGQVFRNDAYLNRSSGESGFVGLKDKNNRNQIHWDLDAKLTTGPETGLRNYYLGKNHFLGYQSKLFFLGVGRREHLFSPKSFSTQYDGSEGLFLEIKPESNLTFQLMIWDFYSGSLLLSKDQFHGLLRKESSSEFLTSEKKNEGFSRSHHRRHSFGIHYGESNSLRFGVHYLELGSFGPNTKDHPSETKKNSADGDSLFSGNFGFGIQFETLSFAFDFLWCKGSDRTRSQIAEKPGTIPIAGEAIQIGTELKLGDFKIRSSHFLSDTAETNQNHQIVKEGYISMGTHPSQTPYLSQIFRMFPSAAVTESGYEKNFALIEGRAFGYLTELVLSYQYQQVIVKLIGNYFVPYHQNGLLDGRIHFQKRQFEKFFVAEGMLEVALKTEEGFELGVGLSQLYLPESMGISSNFGYVYGRYQI